MKTKTTALTLVFAIAFLAAANVNAGIITSLSEKQQGYGELFTFSVNASEFSLEKPMGVDGTATPLTVFEGNGFDVTFDGANNLFGKNKLAITLPTGVADGYLRFSTTQTNKGLYGLSVDENNPGNVADLTGWNTDNSGSWIMWGVSDVGKALDIWFSSAESRNFTVSLYGTTTGSNEPDNSAPEPATLAVLGLGLAGLGAVTRRRRQK